MALTMGEKPALYRTAGLVTHSPQRPSPSPTHSALGLQPLTLLLVDVPFDASLTSTDEHGVPHSQGTQGQCHRTARRRAKIGGGMDRVRGHE